MEEVIFRGLLYSDDRHDELAAVDLSMTAVTLTSRFVLCFIHSYAYLMTFFIIPVLFCIVFEHETI